MVDRHLCPESHVTPATKIDNKNPDIEESPVESGNVDPLSRMPLTHDAVAISESPGVASIEYLVFDCSALSYVDLSGTKVLISLQDDLHKKGITFVFSNCSEPLMKQLDRCKFFKTFPKSQIYPSIMDAILSIQNINSVATVNSLASSAIPSSFPVD